jgi:dihydrofolate synthase/folylpolyglutamate synthase
MHSAIHTGGFLRFKLRARTEKDRPPSYSTQFVGKQGIRAGLFTSPHLISITERIRIDGREISEENFARFTEEVRTAAEELVKRGKLQTLPTFFEHVTAIALLAFREAKVELAILETGLGGRLDSTTASGAQIVAITAIAMDHQEYLGNTLPEIARRKRRLLDRVRQRLLRPRPKRQWMLFCDGAAR